MPTGRDKEMRRERDPRDQERAEQREIDRIKRGPDLWEV
jgi:hypothetical protein